MRSFVLDENGPAPATIENALRQGPFGVLAAHGARSLSPPGGGRYRFAGWTLDAATRDLFGAESRRAELTSAEFDLLIVFLRRPGQTVSRTELVRALRGRAWDYFDRSIDTLAARLRKKIDTPGAPSLVRSVRGVGYVFCASVAREGAADP